MSMTRRGSILAETVLVMPILLMLIFGVIQFALIWTAKQMTAYAAFCATRAIMVVPPADQQKAAEDAAAVALSWIGLADENAGRRIAIPGWGKIPGSGTIADPDSNGRKRLQRDDHDRAVKILENGTNDGNPVAAVRVTFRFPLLIPGMAVNKIIANAKKMPVLVDDRADFYGDLKATARGADLLSGWPYIEMTESCVLPMPYSTRNFPTDGFKGTNIYGGGS